jgi:hypothetical protein
MGEGSFNENNKRYLKTPLLTIYGLWGYSLEGHSLEGHSLEGHSLEGHSLERHSQEGHSQVLLQGASETIHDT